MPANKEASIPYRIIDKMIKSKFKKYPNIDDSIEACEEGLGRWLRGFKTI